MATFRITDDGKTLLVSVPLPAKVEWQRVEPKPDAKGRKRDPYTLAVLAEIGSRFGGEGTGLHVNGYPLRVRMSATIRKGDARQTTAPMRKIVGTEDLTVGAAAPADNGAAAPARSEATVKA